MGTRLFVGNLPFGATEEDVRTVFEKHGTVKDCHLVIDRETNRSKGFGFVEMSTQEEATKAMAATSGADMGGRPLKVDEARPRAEGGQGGGKRW